MGKLIDFPTKKTAAKAPKQESKVHIMQRFALLSREAEERRQAYIQVQTTPRNDPMRIVVEEAYAQACINLFEALLLAQQQGAFNFAGLLS